MSDYWIVDDDILVLDSFVLEMYGVYGLWLVCLYSSIGCWIFLFVEIFFFVDLGVGLVFVGGVVI